MAEKKDELFVHQFDVHNFQRLSFFIFITLMQKTLNSTKLDGRWGFRSEIILQVYIQDCEEI